MNFKNILRPLLSYATLTASAFALAVLIIPHAVFAASTLRWTPYTLTDSGQRIYGATIIIENGGTYEIPCNQTGEAVIHPDLPENHDYVQGALYYTPDYANEFWDPVAYIPEFPSKVKFVWTKEGIYDLAIDYVPILAKNPIQKIFSKLFFKFAYAQSEDSLEVITFTVTAKPEVEECCSSILFLPGVMGSYLEKDGDRLWPPSLLSNGIEELKLDPNGKSVATNVVATEVLDEYRGIVNIYKSLLEDMESKKGELFTDYIAYPYDWRLSIPDILEQTSEELKQNVRELASGSRTGKVTIIAHSTGGLLAKAVLDELGNEAPNLVDKFIFVGVPQAGTPQAMGSLLHGYDSGILFALNAKEARDFSQNAPVSYHLLPQDTYSSNPVFSVSTPLVTFHSGEKTDRFISEYGNTIHSGETFRRFLLGDDDGRPVPAYSDLISPAKANPTLLDNAVSQTASFGFNWQAPEGIEVHQIAGVGILTLAGIEYETLSYCQTPISALSGWYCATNLPTLGYSPVRVVDGDKTVIEPSALAMSTSSETVKRWWVNVAKYNKEVVINRDHKNLLEISDLRSFIFNNIVGTSTVSYTYVSDTKPDLGATNRLSFTLHSPLSLSYTESDGTIINEQNPYGKHSEYTRYGEVQIIDIFDGETGMLTMNGEATGSFTLDLEQGTGNEVVSTTTYSAIPSSTTTIATIEVSSGAIADTGNLTVDYDGDTTIDFTLAPTEGEEVSLPPPPIEPTITELIDQLLAYIDTNVADKQTKKLLTKQLTIIKTIYEYQKNLKEKLPRLDHLFKDHQALKALIKALEKQVDGFVKAKKLDQEAAVEIKRLLGVIENKL